MKKIWITLTILLTIISMAGESSAELPAPQMTYDVDGLNLSVTWTSVPGATGYNLYYAPYPFAGNDTIASHDVGAQVNFAIDLWAGAAYYIAVRAYDADGVEGHYSNIEDFVVTAPVPNAPTLDHTVTGLNLSASWPAVSGATGYQLTYSSSTSFEPGTTGSIDLGGVTSISYDLWQGAAYYIAVQAYNASGFSDRSNVRFFNMPAASSIASSRDFILSFIDTVVSEDDDGVWQAIVIDEKLTTADFVSPAFSFDGGTASTENSQDASEPETNPDETAPNYSSTSAAILQAAQSEPAFVPGGDYWFAFVDLDPSALFKHVVLYIYGNAATGEITVRTEGAWPEINGEAIYLTNKDTSRLFSPGLVEEGYASPAEDINLTDYYYLISPDYSALQAHAQLLLRAPTSGGYLSVVVDNNNDGTWTSNTTTEEWLLKNSRVSAATGWVWTQQFQLPLNGNNKFGYQNWTRVGLSTQPLDVATYDNDGWSGQADVAFSDNYFNFQPWGGPGYDSDDYDANALGPLDDQPVVTAPASRRGVDGIYICSPDGISIPTKTQALVINLGDSPGQRRMYHNAQRAKIGLDLLLGDGASQHLDKPTKEEAMAAVTSLFSNMTCLDEVWLYIVGHGEDNRGSIRAKNGGGWFRWSEVFAKLDESSNCPTEMDYYQSECRQPGYCNLNMVVQSCYSGHWQDGFRWGVNILTASSKTQPAYARRGSHGSHVTDAFWAGFLGDADLQGDQNGEVSNHEAMLYARNNYAGSKSGASTSLNSNCDCLCEDGMSSTSGQISLVPDTVSFLHQYGVSSCPQSVGSVQVLNEGGGAFNWSFGSSLPPWLSVSTTSGASGDTINLNFTCNGWSENMSSTIPISATDSSSGMPLSNSPASLSISGSVQGF